MSTFRIIVLLLIRAEHFDVLNAFLHNDMQESYTLKYGPVFLAHPV